MPTSIRHTLGMVQTLMRLVYGLPHAIGPGMVATVAGHAELAAAG